MHSKLDADLQQRIEGGDQRDVVTVVIELAAQDPPASGAGEEPGLSRQQRIARRKADFDARADELVTVLEGMGAHGLERAWINQTVKAAVPVHAIGSVAALGSVAAVGMPRGLLAEDA